MAKRYYKIEELVNRYGSVNYKNHNYKIENNKLVKRKLKISKKSLKDRKESYQSLKREKKDIRNYEKSELRKVKKEKFKKLAKKNLYKEYKKSLPDFKLTSTFLFLIMLIITLGKLSFPRYEFRYENEEPKSSYIDKFVELSEQQGNYVIDGFKNVFTLISDTFNIATKLGQKLGIIEPTFATDWMKDTKDEMINKLTPWDDISNFFDKVYNSVADAWDWLRGN